MQYANDGDALVRQTKVERVWKATQQDPAHVTKDDGKRLWRLPEQGEIGIQDLFEFPSQARTLGFIPLIGRPHIGGGIGAESDAVTHSLGRRVARTSSHVRPEPSPP